MRVRVGCEFEYHSDGPVPMVMLVRVQPDGDHQTLYESRWTDPDIRIHEYVDLFQNHCWRFVAPAGPLRIRYDALVAMSNQPDPVVPDAPLVSVEQLPDQTLVYLLPSRYIQSDLLIQTAWELFGATPPTWQRVQAVCDWVHANISYQTGSSDPTITAMDVFERRIGVCRDFALLATGLCRALNIPARYTFGYLPDIAVEPPDVPMDFHAWFEAFVAGRWYAFDARHNVPRIGRVVIGRGRDAADVALSTQFGGSRLSSMVVWSDEVLEGADPASADDNADELEAAELAGAPAQRMNADSDPLARAVFKVRQHYRYVYTGPVTNVKQKLIMIPPDRHGDQTLLSFDLAVRGMSGSPAVNWETDQFSNRVCRVGADRVDRALDFEARFSVSRGPRAEERPGPVAPEELAAYLSFTALTATDDRIRSAAQEIQASAHEARTRADSAFDWASRSIAYKIGVTGTHTPAAMALHLGYGVCQDYAHILLALLRAMRIPARYVSGHLLGEGAPHAWVEVLLFDDESDRIPNIVAFDPTHHRHTTQHYLTVAVGRDFADVTSTSGVFSGAASGRLHWSKHAELVGTPLGEEVGEAAA